MSDVSQVRTQPPPQGPAANGAANGHAPAGHAPPPAGAPGAPPAPGAAGAPHGPAAAPQVGVAPASVASTQPKRSGRRWPVLGLLLVVVLAVGGTVGYRYYYDSTHFVSTDNAQLAGRLVQV